MKFWDDVGDRSYFPTPFLMSISCPSLEILALKVANQLHVIKNRSHSFWTPIFYGVEDPIFFWQFVTVVYPTVWQSLVELCGLKCMSKARQWRKTQNLQGVGENYGPIFLFLAINLWNFGTMLGTVHSFQCHFLIVYIMFFAGDIGRSIFPWVAKSSKKGSFWTQILGANTQKISLQCSIADRYTSCVKVA